MINDEWANRTPRTCRAAASLPNAVARRASASRTRRIGSPWASQRIGLTVIWMPDYYLGHDGRGAARLTLVLIQSILARVIIYALKETLTC